MRHFWWFSNTVQWVQYYTKKTLNFIRLKSNKKQFYIVHTVRHYILLWYISAQSMTIYNEYNVTSIGCFHCTSIGGDNPACEDPFNSTEAFQKGLYKDNCLAGLKGRGGLYPATACIKFDGYYSKCFSTVLENNSKSDFFVKWESPFSECFSTWIMKNSKVARPEGRKFFLSLENFLEPHCVWSNLFIGCSSHAQRGKGHKSAPFFASENSDTAGFCFLLVVKIISKKSH